MERLKYYLLQMDNSETTFKEIYNGEAVIPAGTPSNPSDEDEVVYDNVYWSNDISVMISGTHKLAQDRPTLTWQIPVEKLGILDLPICIDAVADRCLRAFGPYIDALNAGLYNRSRPDTETGRYYLCRPGGEILRRNTAFFELCPTKGYANGGGARILPWEDGGSRPPRMCLCIRMQVQLPRKKIKKTLAMLCKELPKAVDCFIREFDSAKLKETVALAEKQAEIRRWLKTSDYCAFIANGSILPRAKSTDLPLEKAVPFLSAPEDEVEIGGVRGMGIRRGVTVITGGGYSGKSTLIDAIAAGIYDHVLKDGRELCITDESAVTICAEDGRSVKCVNISPFIKWLPGGDTRDFSTEHASGSTSQAANIMEAIECGARLLLIDEDKSATNFMIRDGMMKELIEKEPITPFTDRVRELYCVHGVSTILVIGGSGEYLSVADRIYRMDEFMISDVTETAKSICDAHGAAADRSHVPAVWEQQRTLLAEGFSSYPGGSGSERLEVLDLGFIRIGDEQIDVRGLRDIATNRQLDALGFMLRYLEISNRDCEIDLGRRMEELYERIDREGVDVIYSSYFTTCGRFLDLPRKQELAALVNRMRYIRRSAEGREQNAFCKGAGHG